MHLLLEEKGAAMQRDPEPDPSPPDEPPDEPYPPDDDDDL